MTLRMVWVDFQVFAMDLGGAALYLKDGTLWGRLVDGKNYKAH